MEVVIHLVMFLFFIFTIYVLLFIINIFLQSDVVTFVMGLFGIVSIVFSFRGANGTYKILSIIFFSVTVILFLNYNLSIQDIPYYFTSMGLLLSLLYMVPFFHYLIKTVEYDKSLYRIIQSNTKNLSQFYRRTSITNYILVLFIFFSAIPIVYDFVKEKLKNKSDELFHRFASESILRSFAAVNVWNPIEVYIALVLTITSVSYLSILPILIGFSILVLLIDWGIALKYRNITNGQTDSDESTGILTKTIKKSLHSLSIFFILFMILATIVHFSLHISFFESVIIIIIPYTVTWSLVTGNLKKYFDYTVSMIPNQVKTMQNFMFLFLSLGFFNSVIEETNLFVEISELAYFLIDKPLILFVILQLSALFFAYIGIHPLVTISLQGLFLVPFLDVLNPISISIVMITSTLAADASGTFNVPITMLSLYMKRNPYRLTWWNFGYSMIFGFSGVIVALILL